MPVEFIGMIAPQEYSEIIPPTGLWAPTAIQFACRPRRLGEARHRPLLIRPDGFIVAPGCSGDRAARRAVGPSPRLHRPDRGGPQARHARSVLGRTAGAARDHRGKRRRAGARRRLPRQGRAVPPHGRVPRRGAAYVDGHRTVRLRRRVLHREALVLRRALRARASSADLLRRFVRRGRRRVGQARRRVRALG